MLFALLPVRDQAHHLEAAGAMGDRLLMSLSARCGVRRQLPVRDCPFCKACFAQVMSNELRLPGGHIGGIRLKNVHDPSVEFLPPAFEEAFIGSIPHECMLERVCRLRWGTAFEHKFRRDKLLECRQKFGLTLCADGSEHSVGELATDHSRLLGGRLGGRETIQARHEAVVERGRDDERQ